MFEELSPHNLARALIQFDDATLRRAGPYVNDRTISPVELDDGFSDSVFAAAVVRGTKPYTTYLRWVGDELVGRCTCPVGINCKHAAALAFFLAQSSTDRGLGDTQGRVCRW